MIRNIVFDMGGVLVSYNPMITCLRLADSPEDAQAICDALFGAPEWEQQLDGGLISEEAMLALAQQRLSTPAQKEAAAAIFAEYHTDAMATIPGMEDIIQALHSRGFRIYLLSNAGVRIETFWHLLPRLDLFDGLLVSYREKLLKPDPRIYRRLLEKFSLEAEECLFVDDRPINTQGAEAVGLSAYCIADGDVPRLAAYLEALPDPA